MQAYEAPKADSLTPRKYIHLGLVDWKLPVGFQGARGLLPNEGTHRLYVGPIEG